MKLAYFLPLVTSRTNQPFARAFILNHRATMASVLLVLLGLLLCTSFCVSAFQIHVVWTKARPWNLRFSSIDVDTGVVTNISKFPNPNSTVGDL